MSPQDNEAAGTVQATQASTTTARIQGSDGTRDAPSAVQTADAGVAPGDARTALGGAGQLAAGETGAGGCGVGGGTSDAGVATTTSPRWKHFMRGTARSKAYASFSQRPKSPGLRFFLNNGYQPREPTKERLATDAPALTKPTVAGVYPAFSRIGRPQTAAARPAVSYGTTGPLTGASVVNLGLPAENARLETVTHAQPHVASCVVAHYLATSGADLALLPAAATASAQQERPRTAGAPNLPSLQARNAATKTSHWASSAIPLRPSTSASHLQRPMTAG